MAHLTSGLVSVLFVLVAGRQDAECGGAVGAAPCLTPRTSLLQLKSLSGKVMFEPPGHSAPASEDSSSTKAALAGFQRFTDEMVKQYGSSDPTDASDNDDVKSAVIMIMDFIDEVLRHNYDTNEAANMIAPNCAAGAMLSCGGTLNTYDFSQSETCRSEAKDKCAKSSTQCEEYDTFRLSNSRALLPQCIQDGRLDPSHQVEHQSCSVAAYTGSGGYTRGNPWHKCFSSAADATATSPADSKAECETYNQQFVVCETAASSFVAGASANSWSGTFTTHNYIAHMESPYLSSSQLPQDSLGNNVTGAMAKESFWKTRFYDDCIGASRVESQCEDYFTAMQDKIDPTLLANYKINCVAGGDCSFTPYDVAFGSSTLAANCFSDPFTGLRGEAITDQYFGSQVVGINFDYTKDLGVSAIDLFGSVTCAEEGAIKVEDGTSDCLCATVDTNDAGYVTNMSSGIFNEVTNCIGSDLSPSESSEAAGVRDTLDNNAKCAWDEPLESVPCSAQGSANYWVPQSNYVASSSEFEDCLDSTFEWLYGKDDAVGLDKFAFTTSAANPLKTEYPNQNAYWTRMREHEDPSKKSNWGLWTHYVTCQRKKEENTDYDLTTGLHAIWNHASIDRPTFEFQTCAEYHFRCWKKQLDDESDAETGDPGGFENWAQDVDTCLGQGYCLYQERTTCTNDCAAVHSAWDSRTADDETANRLRCFLIALFGVFNSATTSEAQMLNLSAPDEVWAAHDYTEDETVSAATWTFPSTQPNLTVRQSRLSKCAALQAPCWKRDANGNCITLNCPTVNNQTAWGFTLTGLQSPLDGFNGKRAFISALWESTSALSYEVDNGVQQPLVCADFEDTTESNSITMHLQGSTPDHLARWASGNATVNDTFHDFCTFAKNFLYSTQNTAGKLALWGSDVNEHSSWTLLSSAYTGPEVNYYYANCTIPAGTTGSDQEQIVATHGTVSNPTAVHSCWVESATQEWVHPCTVQ